jgi:hypothetical protein
MRAAWSCGAAVLLILVVAPGAAEAQITEQLYQGACDGGDVSACTVFGLMVELGQGVPQDVARARDLYRRACEGGELVGCTNLGLMYEEGVGGPQSLEEAEGRYRIACEGGEQLACELLAVMREPDSADEARYTKRGRVADAETTTALSNALVEVPELELRAVSDRQGLLSLGRLPEGTYRLTAKRLGYLDLEGELQVPGGTQFMVMMDRSPDPETGPGGIVGRVTDAGGGAISDVDIDLVEQQGVRTLSNPQGRFGLTNVEPGLVQVRFTRIG